MIYLFTGDDSKKRIASYRNFFIDNSKGLEVFFVTKNDFDFVQIESLFSGRGLFFNKSIVVLSSVFEKKENKEFVLENLDFLNKSPNLFLFLERDISKKDLAYFKEKNLNIFNFELPKVKKEKFDNFLIANVFMQKNKKVLWIYYRQAIDLGVALEEIVGVLFWKVKDALIKKNFSKFSEKELILISQKLSCLLPEARKEGKDAEVVLERFLIEVF